MIHWLHSIGDSHVVFVTLSSRTCVSLPCADPNWTPSPPEIPKSSDFFLTGNKLLILQIISGGRGHMSWNTEGFSRLHLLFLGGKDVEPASLGARTSWEPRPWISKLSCSVKDLWSGDSSRSAPNNMADRHNIPWTRWAATTYASFYKQKHKNKSKKKQKV